MRKRYYHKKLIRDKIPQIIESFGDEYKTRVMKAKEYDLELRKKLVEEAKEASGASKEDLLNELADVLELLKSLSSLYKIPFSKVSNYQAKKRKERGGFSKKLFLIWSTGKGGK